MDTFTSSCDLRHSSFDVLRSAPPHTFHAMISPVVMKELLSVRLVLNYLPASPSTDKGWTEEESQLFWIALVQNPQGPWTTIAEFIGTKTARQTMTHAQKLRQKLKRWNKRLRRNPAACSLMDEISVPDGRTSRGPSLLNHHPVLVKSAVRSLSQRELADSLVKFVQSAPMKPEDVFTATSAYSGGRYELDATSYMNASTTGAIASSHELTLVVSTTSCYKQPDVSAGLPPLYPPLNGPSSQR